MSGNKHNKYTNETRPLYYGAYSANGTDTVTNGPLGNDTDWSVWNQKMLTIPLWTVPFSLAYNLTCAVYMILRVILGVLANFLQNISKGQDGAPSVSPDPFDICYRSLSKIDQLSTKYQALC